MSELPTCAVCQVRPVYEKAIKRTINGKLHLINYPQNVCKRCESAQRALAHYWRSIGMPLGKNQQRRAIKWLKSYPAGVRSAKGRSVPEWMSRTEQNQA